MEDPVHAEGGSCAPVHRAYLLGLASIRVHLAEKWATLPRGQEWIHHRFRASEEGNSETM